MIFVVLLVLFTSTICGMARIMSADSSASVRRQSKNRQQKADFLASSARIPDTSLAYVDSWSALDDRQLQRLLDDHPAKP